MRTGAPADQGISTTAWASTVVEPSTYSRSPGTAGPGAGDGSVAMARPAMATHGWSMTSIDQGALPVPVPAVASARGGGRPVRPSRCIRHTRDPSDRSPMSAPQGPAERLVQIGLELPEPDPEAIYREIRNEMNRPRLQSGPEQAGRGPGRGAANLTDASREHDQNREHDDDTAGRRCA